MKSAFGERTDLVSSVAFWYQEGIASDQPPVPYGPARLPQGNASQIEVEAALAEVRAEKGKASLVPDLFWSKDVILFEAEGPGSRLEVPFDVPEDGDYEVYTQLAKGSDYGDLHRAPRRQAADGAAARARAGRRRAPADADRRLRGRDLRGRRLPGRLAAAREGTPHADATCASAGTPPRAATTSASTTSCSRRRARRRGPRPPPCASRERPSGSVGRARRGRSPTPTRSTRGLAAIELRARGAAALPGARRPDGGAAGPGRQRAAHVRERHRGDRARGGARGAGSHRGLLGAGRAGPRPARLRRAPSARSAGRPPPALPVLREIAKQPRVRWAAEAAIRRIGDDAP